LEYVIFLIIVFFFSSLNFSNIYLNRINKNSSQSWTTHIGSSYIWKHHSKIAGIVIFFGDSVLKGLLPIFIAKFIIDFSQLNPINEYYLVPILFTQIIGNNWSIFMRLKGGRGMAIIIGSLLGINSIMAIILYSLYLIIYLRIKDGGPAWIISIGISCIFSLIFSMPVFFCYLICFFLIILKRITGNSLSNNYRIIFNRIIFDRNM
tara:strand:- start:498 stop:1115 length:618 start_codon:yes stop_codon:yes gene_type:complete